MKLLVLYRPNSDQESPVITFTRDLERFHPGVDIEKISLETRDGADKAALFGATVCPAIVAVAESDGRYLNMWQGLPFPLMDEVAAYAVGEN